MSCRPWDNGSELRISSWGRYYVESREVLFGELLAGVSRSHNPTYPGCIVSSTTRSISAVRRSTSVSSRAVVPKAASTLATRLVKIAASQLHDLMHYRTIAGTKHMPAQMHLSLMLSDIFLVECPILSSSDSLYSRWYQRRKTG